LQFPVTGYIVDKVMYLSSHASRQKGCRHGRGTKIEYVCVSSGGQDAQWSKTRRAASTVPESEAYPMA
jgi:hypothetical protein